MSTLTDATKMGLRQLKAAKLMAETKARLQIEKSRPDGLPVSSAGAATASHETDLREECGPVGQGEYLVGQGECLSSIAAAKGYHWETIWNDPANAQLKLARKNPNALLPGDRLALPSKMKWYGTGQTEMRHRIVRHGEPSWLVIKLVDESGTPRSNLPYVLQIDIEERIGTTDGDGILRERIPGGASRAILRIDGEKKEQYFLKLGHIDPVNAVSGMQSRLKNLGYNCGKMDGKMGPRTLAALNRFRTDVGLPTSSRVDDQTLARLEQYHDQMESIQRRDPEPPDPIMRDEDWLESPPQQA